ncbi:MAG: imidazole glycerol phosphate synthase subunit HisH [Acidobacteriota bacterium]|nr:imidazole glycerol phosphate synthase subunit HisH [Acidobacteriota bacterium]
MIALIDYGAGNLTSVRKALSALGAEHRTPTMPGELAEAQAIIVPGVGHFQATARLDEAWRQAILAKVEAGCPLLGVCVGMQWLYEGSTEAPDVPGLGLLKGRCERLPDREASGARLKVPHVGWNSLEPCRKSPLLDGIEPGAQVYFTHSYAGPVTEETEAATEYGTRFAALVARGRVAGMQFHPEKSGVAGLRLLRNFLEGISSHSDAVETDHRLSRRP